MAKKKAKVDTGYSAEETEEIKNAFIKNDITAYMAPGSKPSLSSSEAGWYARVKRIFGNYWRGNLPNLGINRSPKNYSNDAPVNFLQSADTQIFGKQIAQIAGDEAKCDEAFDRFIEMYEEPLFEGCKAYAESVGKDPDDITEEECCMVLEKIADVINEELIKVVMIGQQVPEVFGITYKEAAHEDFNKSILNNFDKNNFDAKWTHYKTKLGAPLFFSELSEEEVCGLEGAKSFFDKGDEGVQEEYEMLRDAFADTLDSTDREIYYMREQGKTQEEIAQLLGYKTHSAVTKRLQKMRVQLDEFLKQFDTIG